MMDEKINPAKGSTHHSQREKKIFLPEFNRALLMIGYL